MIVVLVSWIFLVFFLQTQVLVVSQNLTSNSNDLKGLNDFIKGSESPIDGWWSANSSSSSCCNWVGITCNSSSGRITKLQLPYKGLSGHLSDSISLLNHLTTLNLSYNFLSGPLPNSLFHLTHLETLDLSGNVFYRGLPVSINLPLLQVFDISNNQFTGFLPLNLCVNSTGIRVLNFAINYFNGTISPQLRNCSFLQHLSVASNFISGIIPNFLLKLPKLQELVLEDNEFTGISGIGDSISRIVNFDISSNRFSGNMPDLFHNFPNLSYFSAHSNNLSGFIPPSLLNSRTIYSLNLRNNSFGGSIDFNCSMMVNLTFIDLSNNNFSGTIPASLASCSKLKALNLANNKFTGQIPESFKNFQSLSYLSLSNCSFNNLSSTLKILQNCPNLTILVLTMNFYNEQLPDNEDLQFKALKALMISDCRLTGSIPLWLNGLTQLQLLDVSSNHLTETIPAYFGDFKSLFYLDLSNNSFSGEIPKNLTELQSLIWREISFEEPISNFQIYKSRNLISNIWLMFLYDQIMIDQPLLDLSYNLLTGPIWPEFGNLKNLIVLNLNHNNLSGTIPTSLSYMKNIEKLDLSYNSLTGRIPESLGNLYFLSNFSVAYNHLTGNIPSNGQFETFTGGSFEGNSGLCGKFLLKCEKSQTLLETQVASEKEEHYITRVLAFTGLGTGFLITVFYMLVVPLLIKGSKHN